MIMKKCEAVPIRTPFQGPDEVVSSTVEALDGLTLETKNEHEREWKLLQFFKYKNNKVYFVK